MLTSKSIEQLNGPQREAVTAPAQHMLVLAGAGSGKTRVLTHRIAYLLQQEQVSPFSILAVTFTNKAAYEMRGRIEQMCQQRVGGMWVGTFHGLAHRFLRTHWQDADLPEAFQILDADDQQRLIKRLHRSLALDENKWSPKQSQWFINKQKEEGRRAKDISAEGDYYTEVMLKVYRAYEELCQRSGLVDFTELLLRSLELFLKNAEIRHHYQQRFHFILVDEFQDTNTIQYRWLHALTGPETTIMAVGDDDQSIYSWRGAKVENMMRFNHDFKPVKTIRLEQNYRSTQTILNAANAVIANNPNRLGKDLWTAGDQGDVIKLYTAFNERDEAHYITSTIRECLRQGIDYRDIAILYRANAQSRVLEEALIDAQIPYRIYGGLKFFERAEIKDALAYLRLVSNRFDDAAFERIVNTPTRGIGNTTLESIRDMAKNESISLWRSSELLIEHNALSARASNALNHFLHLINQIDGDTKSRTLDETTDILLHKSGLLDMYKKDRSEKGLSRVENLEELINATATFKVEHDSPEAELSPLAAFLSHVALETGENQSEPHTNCVSLMTLHSAKGLEFPVIFLTGLEEELFPHRMAVEENGLEEERRLCYVGMTRAMQLLYLTHAECRRLHGREHFSRPSRFIAEIPDEYIHAIRPTAKVSRPASFQQSTTSNRPSFGMNKQTAIDTGDKTLHIGERVSHKKFGVGTIVNYEGRDAHARVQVKFDKHGLKWLVASFAKLEVI